jgi:hypothetical protein
MAEEGVVLEDEPDLALLRRQVRDVPAVEEDLSAVHVGEPRDHPEDRALAAAARPEEHEELAVLDLEAHVVDDGLPFVPLVKLVEHDRHETAPRLGNGRARPGKVPGGGDTSGGKAVTDGDTPGDVSQT